MQGLTLAAASLKGLCVCMCCAHVCEEDKPQLQKVKEKKVYAQLQGSVSLYRSPRSLLDFNENIRNLLGVSRTVLENSFTPVLVFQSSVAEAVKTEFHSFSNCL